MKSMFAALFLAACLFAPSLAGSAAAEAPGDGAPPDSDLGIQLSDMLATVADLLTARQEQIANESHLGSAAAGRRLRSAILRAPDVSVRGANPFIEGWLLGDD